LILPLLVSDVTVPAFDTPAPPGKRLAAAPPFPPLIAPLLDSVLIVPALDTPAPPVPPENPAPPFPPPIVPVARLMSDPIVVP